MAGNHKKYGGSTATRTLACPGWVKEAAKAPKLNRGNANADRGTALHSCLDQCMMGTAVPFEFLDVAIPVEDGEPYTVTAEDVEELEIAIAAANAVMDKYRITELVTEQEVQVNEDIGGSADVIGCGDQYSLTLDWKTGYSAVDAHKNDQALFYTWAASSTPEVADMFAGKRHVVAIVQPKISDEADVYELEEGELEAFSAEFLAAVDLAESANPPMESGDHCQYCPAAPYCKVKRADMTRFLALSPAQSEDLSVGMAMVEAMKEQIKVIEAEVFAALENDEKVPGWKLVAKQARRHWIDEEQTELALRKMRVPVGVFMEQKLLSVAQLEKALKKSKREVDITPYFTNSSSGNTIAPESDKRPAVPGKSQMPEALAALMTQ